MFPLVILLLELLARFFEWAVAGKIVAYKISSHRKPEGEKKLRKFGLLIFSNILKPLESKKQKKHLSIA